MSYDTGESYTPPSTSRRSDPTTSYSPTEDNVRDNNYEAGAPILVNLGGGLTPSRIVKKIPEEFEDKTLIEVVKYMITPDNLATNEETSIAEAVRDRMTAPDYMAIMNNRYNLLNDRLKTDVLKDYLMGDSRNTEGGEVKFNKVDMAIVSHDEGGKYDTLDRLL